MRNEFGSLAIFCSAMASSHSHTHSPLQHPCWLDPSSPLPPSASSPRCFVDTARALVSRFQRTEMRRRFACGTAMQRLLGAGPSHYAALAERAYWCRKYARSNAVSARTGFGGMAERAGMVCRAVCRLGPKMLACTSADQSVPCRTTSHAHPAPDPPYPVAAGCAAQGGSRQAWLAGCGC